MERFRMVQLNPDNARLELFDGDKSLGYFWTPKMANHKIKEVLESENGKVVLKDDKSKEVKSSSVSKTIFVPKRRGRPSRK